MKEEDEKNLREIVGRRIEFFRRKPESAIYKPRVSSKHVSGHCPVVDSLVSPVPVAGEIRIRKS